jgi:hypothetical protein
LRPYHTESLLAALSIWGWKSILRRRLGDSGSPKYLIGKCARATIDSRGYCQGRSHCSWSRRPSSFAYLFAARSRGRSWTRVQGGFYGFCRHSTNEQIHTSREGSNETVPDDSFEVHSSCNSMCLEICSFNNIPTYTYYFRSFAWPWLAVH